MTQHHRLTLHAGEHVIPLAQLHHPRITADQLLTPHQGPTTHIDATPHSTTPPTPHTQHDTNEPTGP